MSKTVGLALLGAGTVGGGVLTLLQENADLLYAQTGKRFVVRHVVVRDLSKPRTIPIPPRVLTTDAQRAFADPKVSVVLELMGGLEPARSYIREALQRGKHVITANKLVMAVAGEELIRLAQQQRVRLLYEASVAGSLPILTALQGALAGNRITRVVGIVNSTTNFILREMERAVEANEPAETAYANALRKAQELGYAEADPTSDVEGYDAQYKTAILARLAFLQYVPVESVYREGITHLSGRDLLWAARLQMGLKLLSITERLPDGRLCARVHPTLIPREHPLYAVRGAFSGVWLQGNGFQEMFFHGFGAGARATASAVIGDLIEIARHPRPLKLEDPSLRAGETAPIDVLTMRYYLRFRAPDEASAQPLRNTLTSLGAKLYPPEVLPDGIEQVALTPPLLESDLQRQLAEWRRHTALTVQCIRLLE
ncbi:MAG: homoserine dehydrogenase [Fimbriimonadales bacterium]|nr:homoserine dehydrogenase [Fimbriimonadales bacterium]MDW8051010.1 homoserine dehydrogenase [Armatimonadota bacterium]